MSNPWTPPDPDAWKPKKSAAASSPESERRLEELQKLTEEMNARHNAEHAPGKEAFGVLLNFLSGQL
jgi:hypothetical protein